VRFAPRRSACSPRLF